jgi:hypothetical protein
MVIGVAGRNVESPGEDPFLAGSYGTAYTQGLQQYTGVEKVVQSVVTLKHFLACMSPESSCFHLTYRCVLLCTSLTVTAAGADSIEDYNNVTRYNVDVKVSAYDMANTYSEFPHPHFRLVQSIDYSWNARY